MAITYDGVGGVFTRLGKIIKTFNILEVLQRAGADTLPDLEDEILDAFGDDRAIVSGLFESLEGNRRSLDGWKETLAGYAEATIVALAAELDASNAEASTVWPLFLARMADDAETVDANAVALTAVTADGDNLGDGELIASIKDAMGVDVEIAIAETLRVACITDASGGGTEGAESFQISGEIPAPSRSSYDARGTGVGPTITVANGSGDNVVLNGDFETFTVANTPDDWDVDAGVVGTHIYESTDEYRGVKCLKLKGDGALATIGISQTFAESSILPLTKYAVGVRINTSGVAAGTIKVRIAGTGVTPGATEKIEIAAAWPVVYTFYSFFINMPAVIPDDLEIIVEVTGTLTNNALVYVDDLAMVPATVHGAVSLAAFAGAARFAVGDLFTFDVTNDEAGIFQTMIGRLFGVQLPSATGDAETIADALAQ